MTEIKNILPEIVLKSLALNVKDISATVDNGTIKVSFRSIRNDFDCTLKCKKEGDNVVARLEAKRGTDYCRSYSFSSYDDVAIEIAALNYPMLSAKTEAVIDSLVKDGEMSLMFSESASKYFFCTTNNFNVSIVSSEVKNSTVWSICWYNNNMNMVRDIYSEMGCLRAASEYEILIVLNKLEALHD